MQENRHASSTASSTDSASDIFTALAHPTRRQILQDLKDGERAAGEIAARFTSTGPTISRHLAVLRTAGLVTERRDANRILYSLVGDRLALSVGDFLSTVCPEQMVLRSIRPSTASLPPVGSAQPAAQGAVKGPVKGSAKRSKKTKKTGKSA